MIKFYSQKGAAMLLFMIFFTAASASLLFGITRTIYSDLKIYNLTVQSKQSYILADSFTEDAAYRLKSGKAPDAVETISLFGSLATTTTTFNSGLGVFIISTEANKNQLYRKARIDLKLGSGASFNFGVQSGNGGFTMTNSSAVNGNLFSNGSVSGSNGAMVYGDVISAGPSGLIDGIHATGSAWANDIRSGVIEGNAYYQTINLSDTSVWGTLYPGSPDEATSSLPIPDEVVEAFKASTTAAIAAGDGTLISATSTQCSSGTYTINSTQTLTGPTKIECNFTVSKNSTILTLTDTLWVTGNITFSQGPTLSADPSTSTDSILVIADDESNRLTSSIIDIANGTDFVAANSPKSYIVLLSMNNSAINGGAVTAINMGQSSTGDVLVYAGGGKVVLGNQINLKEVTGHRIEMGQLTTIDYESGLLNLNFTSGPGGGFEVNSWGEI